MQLALKRLLDIGGAFFLLVLGAPILALTALAIKAELGPPVLFCQNRVGKNDRIFRLYKFRSMTDISDKNGVLLSDENRLTRFGRFLRSTSLDELPELWNILKGDMSFVGPRPLLPEYLPYYTETEKRRHVMRPGLTGLAQINGRNALEWQDRMALDLQYVDRWSLWLDLKIAWSTLSVVLMRRGIHAEGSATMPRFDDYVRGGRKGTAPLNRKKL